MSVPVRGRAPAARNASSGPSASKSARSSLNIGIRATSSSIGTRMCLPKTRSISGVCLTSGRPPKRNAGCMTPCPAGMGPPRAFTRRWAAAPSKSSPATAGGSITTGSSSGPNGKSSRSPTREPTWFSGQGTMSSATRSRIPANMSPRSGGTARSPWSGTKAGTSTSSARTASTEEPRSTPTDAGSGRRTKPPAASSRSA